MEGSDDAAEKLQSFLGRIQRLDEEIKGLNQDKRDVYAEVKTCGFDVRAFKQVVRLMDLDSNERLEHQTLIETYVHALEAPAR